MKTKLAYGFVVILVVLLALLLSLFIKLAHKELIREGDRAQHVAQLATELEELRRMYAVDITHIRHISTNLAPYDIQLIATNGMTCQVIGHRWIDC